MPDPTNSTDDSHDGSGVRDPGVGDPGVGDPHAGGEQPGWAAHGEHCVLIPASTIEDFPADRGDAEARSLLGGWTILWHPRLIAATGQMPMWYRADAPPDPPEDRLFIVPSLSEPMLPESFLAAVGEGEGDADQDIANSGAAGGNESGTDTVDGASPRRRIKPRRVRGGSRAEFAAALGIDLDEAAVEGAGRRVGPADFFALGYASLQVQVMTRRLRYTSNLDELHLQSRLVAAARAWCEGDGPAAVDAMHDCFDALAEERDHYFTSDPSLIDLTLVTPKTLSRLSEQLRSTGPTDALISAHSEPSAGVENSSGVLATPANVLIDGAAAASDFWTTEAESAEEIRRAIRDGRLGFAGGGPAADVMLDSLSFSSAQRELAVAHAAVTEVVGSAPAVYARLGGPSPADLTTTLISLGYAGLIPIDFIGGRGFGAESKVLWRGEGEEIEALTARPIDGSGDGAFLNLAARLGEAIDGGEVATALIARWPGQSCDSLDDLRVVASWSLVLGRFWRLRDYFTDGEPPYHHGMSETVSKDAAEKFARDVGEGVADPISGAAAAFRRDVRRNATANFTALASLAAGAAESEAVTTTESDATDLHSDPAAAAAAAAAARLARAVGADPVESDPGGSESGGSGTADGASADGALPPGGMLFNPVGTGVRATVAVGGTVARSAESPHLFAATPRVGGGTDVSVDIPPYGFTLVGGDKSSSATPSSSATSSRGLGERVRAWGVSLASSLGGGRGIVGENSLRNEFMEVVIDPAGGGVAGVYSGPVRGNRFSLRLVWVDASSDSESTMIADAVTVETQSEAVGTITATGRIESTDGDRVADFRLTYRLDRGSRFLQVQAVVTLSASATDSLGRNPWKSYLGLRTATASESPVDRLLVREKIHTGAGRRMVAPLGVVIDEADRTTLIAGGGLPLHRRAGDRFVDTLLVVAGETADTFGVDYGFDVKQPVAAAQGRMIAPTMTTTARGFHSSGRVPSQGWILYASPRSILVDRVECRNRLDGRLVALVRVIQTREDDAAVRLRFCRDVTAAWQVTGTDAIFGLTGTLAEVSLEQGGPNGHRGPGEVETDSPGESVDEVPTDEVPTDVTDDGSGEVAARRVLGVEGDAVRLRVAGHGSADVLIVF